MKLKVIIGSLLLISQFAFGNEPPEFLERHKSLEFIEDLRPDLKKIQGEVYKKIEPKSFNEFRPEEPKNATIIARHSEFEKLTPESKLKFIQDLLFANSKKLVDECTEMDGVQHFEDSSMSCNFVRSLNQQIVDNCIIVTGLDRLYQPDFEDSSQTCSKFRFALITKSLLGFKSDDKLSKFKSAKENLEQLDNTFTNFERYEVIEPKLLKSIHESESGRDERIQKLKAEDKLNRYK